MRKITLFLAVLSIVLVLHTPNPSMAEYNPTTGRFLQRDPIGYEDGMNLYEYVSSLPVLYLDPMGLEIIFRNRPDEDMSLSEIIDRLKRLLNKDTSAAFDLGATYGHKLIFYDGNISTNSRAISIPKCICPGGFLYVAIAKGIWEPYGTLITFYKNIIIDDKYKHIKGLKEKVNDVMKDVHDHEQRHIEMAKNIFRPFNTYGIWTNCLESKAKRKAEEMARKMKDIIESLLHEKYDSASEVFDDADNIWSNQNFSDMIHLLAEDARKSK